MKQRFVFIKKMGNMKQRIEIAQRSLSSRPVWRYPVPTIILIVIFFLANNNSNNGNWWVVARQCAKLSLT
jgi:hypothetical protein